MTIIRQYPYLPDGVSQSMIDKAMGALPPDEERAVEAATAEYERVQKIMRGLKAKLDAYLEAADAILEAYQDAYNALEDAGTSTMDGWISAMMIQIEDRALKQEDADAAYKLAMDEMPPLDRVIEDARIEAAERSQEERAEAQERKWETDNY